MAETWTQDRVLGLAPDPASAKAGQGLASPRKWVSTGKDDSAAWGECQGSGAKPYQVQVDLSTATFKCSCPSRKFPCKHGIGLMLQVASGQVTAGAAPQWVKEWLEERAAKQAKKTEKPADLTPEKAAERAEEQEERRAKRLGRVTKGMQELSVWLEDLIRTGLASAPTQGLAYFDERSRRLMDAQAPGAARLVRNIGSAAASGDGWQRRTLETAGLAYLLTKASTQIETLPEPLREDVLGVLGMPVSKETLDTAPVISDVWQVVGREFEVEANLKTQFTYLYGLNTQRPVLLLDFAFGAAGLDASVPLGTLYPADLAYYPGHSLRAAIRTRTADPAPLTSLRGLPTLAALLDLHATHLAASPWLTELAAPVQNLTLSPQGNRWFVTDTEGAAMLLSAPGRSAWTALAISSGKPVSLTLATDGRTARPLSIVAGGAFTDLAPSLEVEARS